MPAKKKILIFIDWFVPGYKAGGPIASIVNFVQLMKNDFSLYVFTTDTDLGETNPYENIIPDKWTESAEHGCMIYYARRKQLSGRQIKMAIKEVEPDFVYLNHMFSPWFVVYPLWLKRKGFIRGQVIVSPRGALYESALSIKPYKKMPFLRIFSWMRIHGLVRFHATSEREKEAVLRYLPNSEVRIADDLPAMYQPPFALIDKQPGSLRCIFIARIHPIKNLLFFLERLTAMDSRIAFTIIGPLEDAAYWESCKRCIEQLPANISVKYAGALPSHQLMPYLRDHHLFILPTKGENFGHAIFESFLAGRPVLISDQTPWLRLEQAKVGWDLPLDEPQRFVEALNAAAAWNEADFAEWGGNAWQYAGDFISKRGLKQQYLHLFS